MDYGKLALKKIEELGAIIRRSGKSEERKDYSVTSGSGAEAIAKGETFEKIIRVKVLGASDLKIKFFASLGGGCLAQGFLDGNVIYSSEVTGSFDVVRNCSGVEKGVHEIRFTLTASEDSNLVSLLITAEGLIDRDSDKVYIDAPPGSPIYIESNLSRVSVFKVANGKKTEIYAFYGVSCVKIKKIGTKYYLLAVTENGQACVIKITENLLKPEYFYVADDAVCMDGVPTDSGNIILFASKRGVTEVYFFDASSGEIRKSSSFDGGYDEISATAYEKGYAIITRKGESVYLSVSEGVFADKLTDSFTISILEN